MLYKLLNHILDPEIVFRIVHSVFIIGWVFDYVFIFLSVLFLFINPIFSLLYPSYYVFALVFDKLPFFNYISNSYINLYKKYIKYEIKEDINEEFNRSNKKNQIYILGPHGIFMNGPISIGLFNLTRENAKNFLLFVAPTLIYNPTVIILSKIIQNGNTIQGLTHKNVIKNLKENKYNICLSGGGFEELNLYSNDFNPIYTGRWLYWIRNAIQHGYDINFCYCYGATQDYPSKLSIHDNLSKRIEYAKKYIPFNSINIKFPVLPYNNVKMTPIFFHMELPYCPDITKEETKIYLKKFYAKFREVLDASSPSDGQIPFDIIDDLDTLYDEIDKKDK